MLPHRDRSEAESAADKFMIHAIASWTTCIANNRVNAPAMPCGGRPSAAMWPAAASRLPDVRADGYVARVIAPAQADVIRRIYRETAGQPPRGPSMGGPAFRQTTLCNLDGPRRVQADLPRGEIVRVSPEPAVAAHRSRDGRPRPVS